MIPKASQRGGGKDLATHLLNAFDNELVEVAEVSGAIAPDLHGAFAEWEAIATGLTKCRNYLYSLSVNPDLGQGQLSRAQYMDYVDRVEKALGLSGQPRAIVYHIKDGREHCHVVWSRIDYQTEKAVHLAFDREKLMMVTRQFAREHGLLLPEGYGLGRFDERRQKVSLYERAQERATGLSKEERQLLVTQAWRQSDSPKAFVRALEDLGYVLATGNRPYVLVDIYGGINALPKLIDDRSVRTKDIRAFLEREFPPESLPTVDEAKALVAQHRKAREQFAKARDDGEQLEKLARAQAARRAPIEAARADMIARQERERETLLREQLASRQALRAGYLAETARVRQQREEARPTGLAAFLGRVTGVSAIIHRVQRYKDAKRYLAFREIKQGLAAGQRVETALLQRRHEMQALDMKRQLTALTAVEARERKALEEKRVREQRLKDRAGHEHMPALALDLKPRGRGASVRRAKDRYRDRSGRDQEHDEERAMRARMAEEEKRLEPEAADIDLKEAHREALERQEPWGKEVDLPGDFARAAWGKDSGGDGGDDGTEEPVRISRAERKSERQRSRRRGRDDFERER
ncbi:MULTISPECIES: relaxase/mobilization nuclease domain-containing protein [unclassified Chelatococcus]|uniref:relaxase/mobilization nuclease domain-containing protein n=1 Tax=unclassified Chelatococcus TaxID=2638111 RepID=UPI001BD16B84|nr:MULTISPECIES: relaxase/mobilization nuclease domain-containing protein [unclassified Chelatococcus]CAH1652227.1 Relaxase/mobilization nuclease-like protein [Hyphomicrobiales bacterium]MBS7739958.1 relaxase/mobilization nuclease domain-containing protein [Chelatococcus sp. HY11]MBX3545662.1 relaxase/mobilization nuclease domain-containing protein [Chelatococcus sp.]MCO5078742.1 relaxase/mobilization nuclease domain-containing protein [Chelatococcus sp.]CAH1686050.1 Relaxase/mobilization nucl